MFGREKIHYIAPSPDRVEEEMVKFLAWFDGGLVWYMQKLVDALDEADTIVTTILNKSFFWQKASAVPMTERQTQMLNLFLDGYEAKITSKTWATLAKCSKDTAIRDIQDLLDKNILIEDIPGAKRPSISVAVCLAMVWGNCSTFASSK